MDGWVQTNTRRMYNLHLWTGMKTVNAVVMTMVVVWQFPETVWFIHKPRRSPTRSPSLSACVRAVCHPRMSRGDEGWRGEEGWREEEGGWIEEAAAR